MKRNTRTFLLLPLLCLLAACNSESSPAQPSSNSPVTPSTTTPVTPSTTTPVTPSTNPVAPTTSSADPEPPASITPAVEFTLEVAQSALTESKPTKIVTNHDYRLPSNGVDLSFNSTLLIDYSGEVTCSYSYVYQVLAEISENNDNYYRTISGKKYSVGAQAGDGVEWVNDFEGATTLTKLNINAAMDAIDPDKYIVKGAPENASSLLGADYGVTNLSFSISYEPSGRSYRVISFVMDFKMEGYAGLNLSETAIVHSESTYSYEPVQVVLP